MLFWFGLLVAGANSRHHEPILCSYIQMCAMDSFIKNFYVRLHMFLSDQQLIRQTVELASNDFNAVTKINSAFIKSARELLRLEEIHGYMKEAMVEMDIPPEPPEQAGRTLYERLELQAYHVQLTKSCVQ